MANKKNLSVKETVSRLNDILLNSQPDISDGYLQGVCASIEMILHGSGNYNGFRYITPEESPYGERSCGIIYHEIGESECVNVNRRQYFV